MRATLWKTERERVRVHHYHTINYVNPIVWQYYSSKLHILWRLAFHSTMCFCGSVRRTANAFYWARNVCVCAYYGLQSVIYTTHSIKQTVFARYSISKSTKCLYPVNYKLIVRFLYCMKNKTSNNLEFEQFQTKKHIVCISEVNKT